MTYIIKWDCLRSPGSLGCHIWKGAKTLNTLKLIQHKASTTTTTTIIISKAKQDYFTNFSAPFYTGCMIRLSFVFVSAICAKIYNIIDIYWKRYLKLLSRGWRERRARGLAAKMPCTTLFNLTTHCTKHPVCWNVCVVFFYFHFTTIQPLPFRCWCWCRCRFFAFCASISLVVYVYVYVLSVAYLGIVVSGCFSPQSFVSYIKATWLSKHLSSRLMCDINKVTHNKNQRYGILLIKVMHLLILHVSARCVNMD